MNTSIEIIPYERKMHETLLSIWQHGIKKTHAFLALEDYNFYNEIVDKQALAGMDVWVAVNSNCKPLGFIGIDGLMIEMLFIDPDLHRTGVGTALLDFAVTKRGCTKVDVNEQNPQARQFYKKYGFVECGRTELDPRGKPYPLVNLEFAACFGKK